MYKSKKIGVLMGAYNVALGDGQCLLRMGAPWYHYSGIIFKSSQNIQREARKKQQGKQESRLLLNG